MILLLLGVLLGAATGHLIITVTPSNTQVNANTTVALQILTSSSIVSGGLAVSFTIDFGTQQPCLLNGTITSCTLGTSATASTVTLNAPLALNTYYNLVLSVTNPPYATNFPVSASASGAAFSNAGLVTITPKTIACSLTASSPFVGDTAAGSLQLGNDALPASSKVVINSSLQSTFSNLFAASPSCTSSGALSCSLSNSFG
jgi:hypothetical protein